MLNEVEQVARKGFVALGIITLQVDEHMKRLLYAVALGHAQKCNQSRIS